MKSLLVAVAAIAIGASLTFAACGGDDSTSNSKSAATSGSGAGDTKTDSSTTAGPSGANPTAASSTPGSGQLTGSGADALKNLAKDISKKTYSVSYDLEATGADGKTNKSSLTLSQKPPKSATSLSTGAGAAGSFSFINDGTNSFTCTGLPGGAGQCAKSKSDPNSPLNSTGFSLDKTLQSLTDSLNVTETDGRKVAGADSRCFTIKEASGTEALACFSKSDGIATYIENKATGGTNTKLTATKITTSVDDSVFAPPAGYKVIETAGQ